MRAAILVKHVVGAADATLETICPMCGEVHTVKVLKADYFDWSNGLKNIQTAFPYLDAHQREQLISGIDGKCWDRLFPAEEEAH